MRIGILRPGMDRPGGTETFLKEMMLRLRERHEVVLVTDKAPRGLSVDGVEVLEPPALSRFKLLGKDIFEIESLSIYLSSRLKGVVEEADADVWSTHFWLENLLLSRHLDVPNFFRFPGIKSPGLHWKMMFRLDDPDFYVSNSEVTRRRAEEWFGVECEGTVYAGVDTGRFSPDAEPVFRNEHVNLIYVGRLDTGKGLMGLLQAFRGVGDDVMLHLVGSGSLEESIERKVRSYGLDDRVVLHGRVDHSEVHSYYAAADVFCLPSVHEGFPVSNLEAMASGLPVVVSDIPATREQITDDDAGLFFEYGDWPQLRDRLRDVTVDPGLRARMGLAARNLSKGFDWDKQAERMEGYYTMCAEGAHR